MNHYLAVSPGKTVLRPLAKNILRAAALVEAIPRQGGDRSFHGRTVSPWDPAAVCPGRTGSPRAHSSGGLRRA